MSRPEAANSSIPPHRQGETGPTGDGRAEIRVGSSTMDAEQEHRRERHWVLWDGD